MANLRSVLPNGLKGARTFAMVLGIMGLLSMILGYQMDRVAFFSSYLVAFMLCLGVTLGPMGLWMLHNLVGGHWGEGIKILLHAATSLFPFIIIAFLPLLFGLEELYPWASEVALVQDKHLIHKSWYLNETYFIARAGAFLLLWLVFSLILQRLSGPNSIAHSTALRAWSAIGLIVYVLTVSFASIDWIMSLEPLFYSTIFGLIILAGQLGSTFSLAILLVAALPTMVPSNGVMNDLLHDLGNFLLMSVMFWAYVSFSQLLLIWAAQLPEEILFFNRRFYGGWQWVGITLIVIHFFLPFFLLLFRRLKRNIRSLAWVAALLLLARWIDMVWLVQPSFSPASLRLPWLMVMTPLTLISLWLAAFLSLVERRLYARSTR